MSNGPTITHRERIESYLRDHPGSCDDCLASQLGIRQRQTVRERCTRSSLICRTTAACRECGGVKLVRFLCSMPQTPGSPPALQEPTPDASLYFREDDLRQRLNETLASALSLPQEDYYGKLNFDALLQLKNALAQIHDIVTLKLTVLLIERLGERLGESHGFSEGVLATLVEQVQRISPNASGFDIDSTSPNFIAEVKGCIPMNAGKRFGAAQLKGLTNDVLQMLGRPAREKVAEKLSARTKISRDARGGALKFLGLPDSPALREAVQAWKTGLMASPEWQEHLSACTICDLPEAEDLSPLTVYLVYLTPTEASLPAQGADTLATR